jgi:hypothetical protein
MPPSCRTISFCTTAMGRLDQVRQTLPANLQENSDYPNLDFVLLDYGSHDGLGDWVQSHLREHLDSGRLTYLRLEGVEHYSHAHSKNVCFLASAGDVVCNVDADNFLPRGFAFHLNDLMLQSERCIANYANEAPNNTKGRLAVGRRDFLAVGGYDEQLRGWGWDDKDLRARLVMAGCELKWFDLAYAAYLPHDDARRVENMAPEHHQHRVTSHQNRMLSGQNLEAGKFVANQDRTWGQATLLKNFSSAMKVGVAGRSAGSFSAETQSKMASP